jgi:hypothetical protein
MEHTLDSRDSRESPPPGKVLPFLEYLRNTFYTADDHAYALDLDTPPPRTGWQRPLEAHEKVMSEVL